MQGRESGFRPMSSSLSTPQVISRAITMCKKTGRDPQRYFRVSSIFDVGHLSAPVPDMLSPRLDATEPSKIFTEKGARYRAPPVLRNRYCDIDQGAKHDPSSIHRCVCRDPSHVSMCKELTPKYSYAGIRRSTSVSAHLPIVGVGLHGITNILESLYALQRLDLRPY